MQGKGAWLLRAEEATRALQASSRRGGCVTTFRYELYVIEAARGRRPHGSASS